jgi:hypothetical protein
MTYANIPGIASALSLFAVAYYAFRLNRFIGTPRMGAALCGGLSVLAVLSLFSASALFGSGNSGVAAGAFQTIASLAVVIGMAHVEKVLTEHVRERKAEEEARRTEEEKQADSVSLLQKKIAELTGTNEQLSKARIELEQTAGMLQAELATLQNEAAMQKSEAAEQKRAAEDLARTNNRMAFSHEEESRRTSAALQAKINELERCRVEHERMCSEQVRLRAEQEKLRAQMEKTSKQLADALAASSAAEADAATLKNDAAILKNDTEILKKNAAMLRKNSAILISVRKLLNDATASAGAVVDQAARIRSTKTSHITKLLRPTAKRPGSRLAANGNSKRLPNSIAVSISVLSRQLTREQSVLVQEIDSLKKKIERIQKIAAAERAEDISSLGENHVLQHAETETATNIEPDSSHDTARCTRDEVNGASDDLPVLN